MAVSQEITGHDECLKKPKELIENFNLPDTRRERDLETWEGRMMGAGTYCNLMYKHGSLSGTSAVCEECKENESKYKCPRCGIRTCGLTCVKSHKERTGCCGKRDRTAFVSISEFDDNWLISDYNLLEETQRQAEAARRQRAPFGAGKYTMHPAMKALQHQAKIRDIKLLFLAQGMSKRKGNTSYFDRKRKCIFWRIEWVFEGTGVHLTDARVDENLSLQTVLEEHLTEQPRNAVTLHQLRNFTREPISSLKLFFKKEPCKANEMVFFELNIKETLGHQLSHKCVIEYAVIHIVLPQDAEKFPITNEPKPTNLNSLEVNLSAPGEDSGVPEEPEGVPFREEEIEEGEFVPGMSCII